jgi:hypothetical protein
MLLVATTTLAAQAPVTLLGYRSTAPATWRQTPSSSSMRLAQFTIPGSRASEVAAEVVVYYFGPDQGGSVEANLARWKGQFSSPDGRPVYERIAKDNGGTFPMTIAEYRGTYARGIGQGNAAAAKPNQVLVAVIAETPKGALFFQLFGDIAQATPHTDALVKMVRALK